MTYCYSLDGERFEGAEETREAAVAAALGCDPDGDFRTARMRPLEDSWLSGFLDWDRLRERLSEAMHDTVGEVAGDWPEISQAGEERLESLLDTALLCRLNGEGQWPTPCWEVTDVERHDEMGTVVVMVAP